MGKKVRCRLIESKEMHTASCESGVSKQRKVSMLQEAKELILTDKMLGYPSSINIEWN